MIDRRSGAVRILLVSLLPALLFLAFNLDRCPGGPLLPLDDAYIYLQYARQLAHGQGFHYTPGNGPSTAATSYLYTALLVPLAAVFGDPGAFALALFGLNLALWALFLAVAFAWMRCASGSTGWSWVFVASLALCGPLVWGFFSGMEIPLTALGLALGLWAFARREREGRYPGWTGWALCLLTLSRPEGLGMAALLCVLAAWNGRAGEKRRGAALARLLAPPAAGAALYFGLNLAIAGSWVPQSASDKLNFLAYPLGRALLLSTAYVVDVMKGLLGGTYPTGAPVGFGGTKTALFFAPLTLLVAVPAAWVSASSFLRSRRFGGELAAGLLLAVQVGFVAVTSLSGFQNHRYLVPVLPLVLFLYFRSLQWAERGGCPDPAAEPAGPVGDVPAGGGPRGDETPPPRGGLRRLAQALAAWQFLFLAPSLLFWAAAYAVEAGNLRTLTDEVAPKLRELAPKGPVAILDAGVIPYASGVDIVDLLGLTTPGFRGAAADGPGALAEALAHLPAERQPVYAALQDYTGVSAPADTGFLKVPGKRPLWSSSGVYSSRYEIWDLSERTWLKTPAPAVALGGRAGREADRLDVAWLPDERSHAYAVAAPAPGVIYKSALLAAIPGGTPRVEGGRLVLSGESFRLRPPRPGPALLVVRLAFSGEVDVVSDWQTRRVRFDFRTECPLLSVNGRTVPGTLHPDPLPGFALAAFPLPEDLARGQRPLFELRGGYFALSHHLYDTASPAGR
ncbi:MAG: hypothetical protein KA419_05520 [Acidobacteria bacterium]|nr:hypothetical protein [Acidobacteriota bacterium]